MNYYYTLRTSIVKGEFFVDRMYVQVRVQYCTSRGRLPLILLFCKLGSDSETVEMCWLVCTFRQIYDDLGEEASAASAFADEYLAGVSWPAYEGWGFGSHNCRLNREASGFCLSVCLNFHLFT